MDTQSSAHHRDDKEQFPWPCGNTLNIILIDRSELSQAKTCALMEQLKQSDPIQINVDITTHLDDVLQQIKQKPTDLIMINTNVISDSKIQSVLFEKIETLFQKLPIIALSTDHSFQESMRLVQLGVDDCLDLGVINAQVMKRVLFLSLQRASNYRKLKLINDSQQVVNHLLREATNGLPVRALLQSCLNLINLDAEFIDEQADSAILLTQGDGTRLKTVASSYHVPEHLCERVERALRFALADLDWEISSLFTDPLAEMHESGRRYIPIVHHDKLLGVLMVSFLPGYFDVEDEQRFANEVSRCLGNLLHAGRQQQRFERVFQQNKRLIRSMSSAIIGVDSKDCVTQWNTAAENIFQLSVLQLGQYRQPKLN